MPAVARRSHRRGFTLIELLIVLVVLAVLAALTIPTYNTVVNAAKDSAAKVEVQALSRQAAAEAAAAAANGGNFDLTMFTDVVAGAAAGVSAAGSPTFLAGLAAGATSTQVLTAYPNPAGLTWATGPSLAHLQVSVAISPNRSWAQVAMRSATGKCVYADATRSTVERTTLAAAADPCQAWVADDGSDGGAATVQPTHTATGSTVAPGAGVTPAPGVSAPTVGAALPQHFAAGGSPYAAPAPGPPPLLAEDGAGSVTVLRPSGASLSCWRVYRDGVQVGGDQTGDLYTDSVSAGSTVGYATSDCSGGPHSATDSYTAPVSWASAAEVALTGRAGVKVTWTKTLAAGESLGNVEVYRDGVKIATVPAGTPTAQNNVTSTYTDTAGASGNVYLVIVAVNVNGTLNRYAQSNRWTVPTGLISGACPSYWTTCGVTPWGNGWTVTMGPGFTHGGHGYAQCLNPDGSVTWNGTGGFGKGYAGPYDLSGGCTTGATRLQWAIAVTDTGADTRVGGVGEPQNIVAEWVMN